MPGSLPPAVRTIRREVAHLLADPAADDGASDCAGGPTDNPSLPAPDQQGHDLRLEYQGGFASDRRGEWSQLEDGCGFGASSRP
jgi:hypothetical protein